MSSLDKASTSYVLHHSFTDNHDVGLEQLQWARGVALWAFSLYLCVISAGFVHRLNPFLVNLHKDSRDDDPKLKKRFQPSKAWYPTVGVLLGLQAAITGIVVVSLDGARDMVDTFSWEVSIVVPLDI